jgi:hypothetical protein
MRRPDATLAGFEDAEDLAMLKELAVEVGYAPHQQRRLLSQLLLLSLWMPWTA